MKSSNLQLQQVWQNAEDVAHIFGILSNPVSIKLFSNYQNIKILKIIKWWIRPNPQSSIFCPKSFNALVVSRTPIINGIWQIAQKMIHFPSYLSNPW